MAPDALWALHETISSGTADVGQGRAGRCLSADRGRDDGACDCLAANIAHRVGLEQVEVVNVAWPGTAAGASFVQDQLTPERPARQFGDAPSLFTALQSGAIDVAITDTAILLSQAADSRGRFTVVGTFATREEYGAVYPKGSPNGAVLDRVIQSLLDDGTVAKLTATWLTAVWGQDPAKVPYIPLGAPAGC